jgi:hypothetical protein
LGVVGGEVGVGSVEEVRRHDVDGFPLSAILNASIAMSGPPPRYTPCEENFQDDSIWNDESCKDLLRYSSYQNQPQNQKLTTSPARKPSDNSKTSSSAPVESPQYFAALLGKKMQNYFHFISYCATFQPFGPDSGTEIW